jgi:hypothetical protein
MEVAMRSFDGMLHGLAIVILSFVGRVGYVID